MSAPERKFRTQELRWYVETGEIDGGGVGYWVNTMESINVADEEAAEKLRDEWLSSGKLVKMPWGGIRPAFDYGSFRIRSAWEDCPEDALTAAQAEIARLTAERDAAMAGRVKVKPLVWKASGLKTDQAACYAYGSYGYGYEISSDGARIGLYGPDGRMGGGLPSIEAAKAAAQADYEARVLAALQPDTERAEPVAGALFIDQDGDVCINDGRENNLVFCPAADENGKPLCPDVVAEIVSRFNAPHPAPAPQTREITVQGAARVLSDLLAEADDMHPQLEEALMIANVLNDADQVEELTAALRALADMQKGG